MTKISKKAQAAETTTEVVNTPAEVQTTPIEAPKEEILEEPTFEFKEATGSDRPLSDLSEEEKKDIEAGFESKEQGAPFEENVPAPEVEEAHIPETKEEITKEDFDLDEVMDDDVEFEEAPNEDLPSLDEIKAKERALRKR